MTLLALFVNKNETQLTIYILVMYIREVILGTVPDCS